MGPVYHFIFKGTCDQELFLKNHQDCYKEEANHIFTLTLTVTFLFIFIFFLEIIKDIKWLV